MRTVYESPDIDTTLAQRQAAEANDFAVENFVTLRSLTAGAGTLTTGTRATKPGSAALNDFYFETDTGWLFYWSGTAWLFIAGMNSGTNATRAAITVTANDNGATFFTTDQNKLWRVVAGAWVDQFVSLDNTTSYKVNAIQVVGARKTGWGTPTGTAARNAFATYAGQTVSSPPTQAEVQAIDDHLKILSQHMKGIIDDLHATAGHGLFGT